MDDSFIADETMPTVATEATNFVLTGFGPFGGVPNNPSSVLVQEIGKAIANSNPNIRLCDTIVLETSLQKAQQRLLEVYQGIKDYERTIILHIGVNYEGTQFQLENCAYNEATFRIPDQRGYQPRNKMVLPEKGQLGEAFETDLDVSRLVEALQPDVCPVVVSRNPGRFVCNSTYCYSLDQCNKTNSKHSCLFLHVPPFEIIPKKDQLTFLIRLLQALAQTDRGQCSEISS